MVVSSCAMWLLSFAFLASSARPPSQDREALVTLVGGSFVQQDAGAQRRTADLHDEPEKELCTSGQQRESGGDCCSVTIQIVQGIDTGAGCNCKCGVSSAAARASESRDQDSTASSGDSVEELALKPETDIARPDGILRDLKHQFKDVDTYFQKAAKKVWENGDPKTGKNMIKETGLAWMNKVQEFKHYAGEMRKEAEDTYENIIQSHEKAATKQLSTYNEVAKEKLDDRNAAHHDVAEAVKANPKWTHENSVTEGEHGISIGGRTNS